MLEDLSADLQRLEPLAGLWANKVNMCIDYFTTVLEATATDNQGRIGPHCGDRKSPKFGFCSTLHPLYSLGCCRSSFDVVYLINFYLRSSNFQRVLCDPCVFVVTQLTLYFHYPQITQWQTGYTHDPPGRSDVLTPSTRLWNSKRSFCSTCTSPGTAATRSPGC